MTRVLIAWELGEGYGHVNRLLPIAEELRERGHEVLVAARSLPRAEATFGQRDFQILQAPVWLGGRPRRLPLARTYGEILMRFGYLDAAGLSGLIGGWNGLYELVRPALVIADHAPTALLAARAANMARVLVGTGFSAPPRAEPMPSMQPWKSISRRRLAGAEAPILAAINRVLADRGGAPLVSLADMFEMDEVFLCTFDALDHYGPRPSERYWGPIFSSPTGDKPTWPAGDGPRVFVYLSARYGGLRPLLEQLQSLGYPTLAHVRDDSAGHTGDLGRPTVSVASRPLDLRLVLRQCDAVVCHGGHGTTASTLLAGKPLLTLPQNLEQSLLAYRTDMHGLTLSGGSAARSHEFGDLLRQLVGDPALARNTATFAGEHKDFRLDRQVRAIVDRCEEIVARAA